MHISVRTNCIQSVVSLLGATDTTSDTAQIAQTVGVAQVTVQ
jgi:hypothetical protein